MVSLGKINKAFDAQSYPNARLNRHELKHINIGMKAAVSFDLKIRLRKLIEV